MTSTPPELETKKFKNKHKTRITLSCVTLCSLCFSTYLYLNAQPQILDEPVELSPIVEPTYEMQQVKQPIPTYEEQQAQLLTNLDLDDDLILSFIQQAPHNKNIQIILEHLDVYPSNLIELAIKNEEAIQFVANYKAYSEGRTAMVGLTKPDLLPGQPPLFLQWDNDWGYSQYGNTFMALAGCAPTVVAMAAVGLTGDTSINPRVVADFAQASGYYVPGVGTSWDLINVGVEAFGLQSRVMGLSADHIRNTLNQGDLIIMSVSPGTFTTTGHFILLTGVTPEGKITLLDPNSPKHSEMEWDISVFLNEARNLWRVFAQ